MKRLAIQPAHQLVARPKEHRWLVDDLWSEQAVGLIGGESKTCKSLLALEVAVAVASGAPCLRRFPVSRPGRVLLFSAEDPPHVVRERLEGICCASALSLQNVDIQVITAHSLQLENGQHLRDLQTAVATLKPRLLILDPLVRLHSLDENSSTIVAAMLDLFRQMQRQHGTAVIVVHI